VEVLAAIIDDLDIRVVEESTLDSAMLPLRYASKIVYYLPRSQH